MKELLRMRFLVLPLLLATSCASSKICELADERAVRMTVDKMYLATDDKDWNAVRTLFDDKVHFDMSSLTGKPATEETGASIAAMWKEGLKDIPIVHHQSGNFFIEINGNDATVHNYGMATHHFPEGKKVKTRWFVGAYDWSLKKKAGDWKITLIRFKKKYVDEVSR